ncbi:hypothetical protein DSECCO2_628550 [anaerobic digester metagenome]
MLVEEEDDLRDPLGHLPVPRLALAEGGLGPSATDRLPALVEELGELRLGLAPLLKIEVGTVVDRLDHDLLAAPAGEEDERDLAEVAAAGLEELDSIHHGHLVVRDDDVDGTAGELHERLSAGSGGPDLEPGLLAEKEPEEFEEGGLVVHVQDVDGQRWLILRSTPSPLRQ